MSQADTSPNKHDDSRITERLTKWLTARCNCDQVEITDLSRPPGGYSSETVFVVVRSNQAGHGCSRSLVLKMAPSGYATFPYYDLISQFEAQTAAAAVGVPIAKPILEEDEGWLGAPFILMPRVEGRTIGPQPCLDPWIASLSPPDRRVVYDGFLITLAAIQRADVDDRTPHVDRRDNQAELNYWGRYLAWSCDGNPVSTLSDALAWCTDHRPYDEAPSVLLWGDVRFENCIVGDDLQPRAILDWDMTTVGAAEHDLAWFTSLETTMNHLIGQPLDGIPNRAETIARFEELIGRPLMDFEWYETFAMLRSSAMMTQLNFLRRKAGQPLLLALDRNPLLDLLVDRIT